MNDTKSIAFTQVPNEILDVHLKQLSLPELRVLLVILRQTIGFVYGRDKQRKNRDWISRSLFCKKAGVSPKSVSVAVARLIKQGLVVATDSEGTVLIESDMRRGKRKIYYAYAPYWYPLEKDKMVREIANKCSVDL